VRFSERLLSLQRSLEAELGTTEVSPSRGSLRRTEPSSQARGGNGRGASPPSEGLAAWGGGGGGQKKPAGQPDTTTQKNTKKKAEQKRNGGRRS
jgi:hypothetical protein